MNKKQQEKIKTIENLITQTQSTLTLWTKEIKTYHKQLQNITQQLSKLKLQITNK